LIPPYRAEEADGLRQAIGYVVGLLQINAMIPQSLTPGTALPTLVTIGGVSSQTSVTVAIQ
jgi:uncharacterized protein (TIGR03437 family)